MDIEVDYEPNNLNCTFCSLSRMALLYLPPCTTYSCTRCTLPVQKKQFASTYYYGSDVQQRAGPAPMLDLHLDSVLRLFNEPYFNFSRSFIRILRNDYMWGDLSWLFKPLKIAITRVCCVDGWPYVVHAITFIFLYAKETCCSILHLIQTVMAKIYILHLALALCHHQHSVQYESKNTISIQCGVFVFVLATDMRT